MLISFVASSSITELMERESKKIPRTATPHNVVGPMVRKFRLEVGMTQEQLATACQELGLELTRGTLAKIEAQVRFIKACELYIIAQVLKLPLERFYPADYGTVRE